MQVIDDTLITLKTQRDTIEAEITAERAAVEQKLADRNHRTRRAERRHQSHRTPAGRRRHERHPHVTWP